MNSVLRLATMVLFLLAVTIGLRNWATASATTTSTHQFQTMLSIGGGDPPPPCCDN